MSEPPDPAPGQPRESTAEAADLKPGQREPGQVGATTEPNPDVSIEEAEAVSVLLVQTSAVSMPAEIVARLHQVIATEAERGLDSTSNTEPVRNAIRRSALGSFGENLAADRKDFSIEARHRVAAENRARHLGLN